MLNSMRKNGLRLAWFALGCTALVAITNQLTHTQIAQQSDRQLQQTLGQLLPASSYDNNLAQSCVLLQIPELLGDSAQHPVYVARLGQTITGYIVESVAPQGYGGSIRLLTAVITDGTISRVQVLSHHETPGLGDKIERSKSGWIDSFNGQSLQGPADTRWAVRKDGGMFDSFTGATITPRAVVKGVKNVLVLINQHQNELAQAPACQETP